MNLSGTELPVDAAVFLHGPLPCVREARGQLLSAGVPSRRIRPEVFGPDPRLPDTSA